MVFLEWPKQQRHHEDHYSQSKYEQYQTVLSQQRNKYVFKWHRKVDRDGAEVTSSGKLFQTLAPAIGKTRLPTVGRRKDGTSSWLDDADSYAIPFCRRGLSMDNVNHFGVMGPQT